MNIHKIVHFETLKDLTLQNIQCQLFCITDKTDVFFVLLLPDRLVIRIPRCKVR
jgi:hypothetical protein